MAEQQTEFSIFKQAVEYLDGVLQSGSYQPLLLLGEKEVGDSVLAQLAEYCPLAKLYEGREFPSGSDDTFELGGHEKELGHIHIDFKKQSSGLWKLDNIWMCR